MTQKLQVYITKHALTKGILLREVNSFFNSNSVIMCSALPGSPTDGYAGAYHGEGKEWHYTLEEAQARAELMRTKKLASLEKSMKELQILDLTVANL
jgi:hypothetical protein